MTLPAGYGTVIETNRHGHAKWHAMAYDAKGGMVIIACGNLDRKNGNVAYRAAAKLAKRSAKLWLLNNLTNGYAGPQGRLHAVQLGQQRAICGTLVSHEVPGVRLQAGDGPVCRRCKAAIEHLEMLEGNTPTT